LIVHNCVKFNGRESDYGTIAKEFEQAADEAIRLAVLSGPIPRKQAASKTDLLLVDKDTAPADDLAPE
jgi:hypothetical protein